MKVYLKKQDCIINKDSKTKPSKNLSKFEVFIDKKIFCFIGYEN